MASLPQNPIVVAHYTSPQDFCILEKKHAANRDVFDQRLQQSENSFMVIKPTIGMLLLINVDKWKRAIVDEIGSGYCRCWLVDYGGFVVARKLYKLPDEFKIPVPFVKPACLYGLVGMKKEFASFGINNKPSLKFTPGAIHRVGELIADCKEIRFSCLNCDEEICKGELFLLDKSGNFNKLSETLLACGLACVDTDLFNKAFEQVLSSKKHLLIWPKPLCYGAVDTHTSFQSNDDVKPNVEQKPIEPVVKMKQNWLVVTSLGPIKRKIINEHKKWMRHVSQNSSDESFEKSEPSTGTEEMSDASVKTQIKVAAKKRSNQEKVENKPEVKTKKIRKGGKARNGSIESSDNNNKKEIPGTKLLDSQRNTFVSGNSNVKTKLELQMVLPILVEGEFVPPPIEYLNHVPLHPKIRQYIKKFENICPVQSYMWPMVLRQLNLFAISPPGSGKTLGYLLPLCSLLLGNARLRSKRKTTRALIICAESSVAEDVFEMLQNVLADVVGSKPSYTLVTHPPMIDDLRETTEYSDILITLPAILPRLVEATIIETKQLACVVFEQGSSLFSKFAQEMHQVVASLNEDMVQIVLCSDMWTNAIEEFRKSLKTHVSVCIVSPLEAALFTKTNIEAHLLKDGSENNVLYEIFKNKQTTYKSVVVCDSVSSMQAVEAALKPAGLKILKFDDVSPEAVQAMETTWNCKLRGDRSVLVCTDRAFQCVHLREVKTLVHYNLPVPWIEFVNRFYCLLPANPVQQKVPVNQNNVYVLMDTSSSKKLLKIVEFLKRTNSNISYSFNEDIKVALNRTEEEKSSQGIRLCNELQLFGTCSSNKCERRHKTFSNLHGIDSLPSKGIIEYNLLHINDVNSYLIRITQHKSATGKITNWTLDENADEWLNSHLSNEKKNVKEFARGTICAVFTGGKYKSCVISSLENWDRKVSVKLLESGREVTVHTTHLWQLPEDFHFKSVTSIVLAYAVPPGKDKQWSLDTKRSMRTLIETMLDQNSCYSFTSKILLNVENVLWVQDIQLITTNASLKFDMRKVLTEHRLIDYCPLQLDRLKSISLKHPDEEEMISQTSTTTTSVCGESGAIEWEDEIDLDPEWSYLEDGYNKVIFSVGLSPDDLYVRLLKDDHLLRAFEEKVKNEKLLPLGEIREGDYCIAIDPKTGDYNRSLIIKRNGDDVNLFFVDYGDFGTLNKSKLMQLKEEHLKGFPFQAIHCRLYGLRPVLDCWSPESIDILYDFAMEPNSDVYRTLFAKRVKEQVFDNGHIQYAIVLGDYYNMEAKFVHSAILNSEIGINREGEDLAPFTVEEIELYAEDNGESDNMYVNTDEMEQFIKNFLNIDLSKREKPSEAKIVELPAEAEVNVTNKKEVKAEKNNVIEIEHSNAGYLTPKVTWSQTKKILKLRIDLPHIEDYKIQLLRGVLLCFSATYRDKQYKSKYHLFSKVENKYKCTSSGLYMQIVLTKSMESEWPRLVISNQRQIHISYELTPTDEMDEEEKPLLEIDKCDKDEINDYYYLFSDSDDYSDDFDDSD